MTVFDLTLIRDDVTLPSEQHLGAIAERLLPNGKVIVLYPMIYTFRICIGWNEDDGYDKAWCYPAKSYNKAREALRSWDGEGDPPPGWIKEAGTGRRRRNGDPEQEYFDE